MGGTHGLASTYNTGCRCPACTEAHRQRIARLRAARTARAVAGDPAVPHGTITGYGNWNCRCGDCKKVWSRELVRQRDKRKARAGQAVP